MRYAAGMDKGLAGVITEIEILEDFSATARCDEGFLQVRRLRVHNRRGDGTASRVYRVDVVDRPSLDAVGILLYRRAETSAEYEVLTRRQLRPATHFRAGKPAAIQDPEPFLFVEEIVAGVLESGDVGEAGIRARAVEEALEEAGFRLPLDSVQMLGGPFFVAPGILSEQIYLTLADVTGLPQAEPRGDGSPLEEGASMRWWPMAALLEACRKGEIRDAKTELAVSRLWAKLGPA